MINMINYSYGLKRPFKDFKKLLIGIVISIIPILNLIALGYALKCINTIISKKRKYNLPEWKKFFELFIKGLIAFVIKIIYSLPGLIVLLIVILKNINSLSNITSLRFLIKSLLTTNIFLLLIGLILLIIGGILSPIGIINYVKYKKFSSAFKLKEIINKVNSSYIFTWILSIVYSGTLALIFGLIPFIGLRIASYISLITTYTWFAEAYNN